MLGMSRHRERDNVSDVRATAACRADSLPARFAARPRHHTLTGPCRPWRNSNVATQTGAALLPMADRAPHARHRAGGVPTHAVAGAVSGTRCARGVSVASSCAVLLALTLLLPVARSAAQPVVTDVFPAEEYAARRARVSSPAT